MSALNKYFDENLIRVATLVNEDKLSQARSLVDQLLEVQEALVFENGRRVTSFWCWTVFYAAQSAFKLSDYQRTYQLMSRTGAFEWMAQINNCGYAASMMMEVCLHTGHEDQILMWVDRALRGRLAEGRQEDFHLAVSNSRQVIEHAGRSDLLLSLFEIWSKIGHEFKLDDLRKNAERELHEFKHAA